MKKITSILILTTVIFLGKSLPFSAGVALPASTGKHAAQPAIIRDILLAHGVSADISTSMPTSVKAFKTSCPQSGSENQALGSFGRLVIIDCDGERLKRRKITPFGMRTETEVFNGENAYRYEIDKKEATERLTILETAQYQAVKASAMTFGLLPTLSLLQDPATEVISVGTAEGFNTLSLKTNFGLWTLYIDQKFLIHKVEIDQITVVYEDYREIEQLQLPFREHLYLGGKLAFDLSFIEIDLHAKFSFDHFRLENLHREGAG